MRNDPSLVRYATCAAFAAALVLAVSLSASGVAYAACGVSSSIGVKPAAVGTGVHSATTAPAGGGTGAHSISSCPSTANIAAATAGRVGPTGAIERPAVHHGNWKKGGTTKTATHVSNWYKRKT